MREFLREGGKKRVFLAHDSLLGREVAFALIRTEGLDDAGHERINREAQAMAGLDVLSDYVMTRSSGTTSGAASSRKRATRIRWSSRR